MQAVGISAVCELVSKFEDPMPDDLWHRLAMVMPGSEDLPNVGHIGAPHDFSLA